MASAIGSTRSESVRTENQSFDILHLSIRA